MISNRRLPVIAMGAASFVLVGASAPPTTNGAARTVDAAFTTAVVHVYRLDSRDVPYAKTQVALVDADYDKLTKLTIGPAATYQAFLDGFKTTVTASAARDVVHIQRVCCARQEWFVGRAPMKPPRAIPSVAPSESTRIANVGIGDSAASVVRHFGANSGRDAQALRYEGPRPLTDPRSGCVTRYTFSLSAGRVIGMDFNNEC